MKKLAFVAVIAIAVASFVTSCGNSTSGQPKLKDDVDTLSYAMGLANTQGLIPYLVQMDIDTTYMDAFVKGLNEGANAGNDSTKNISMKNFMLGFIQGVKGKKGLFTVEQAAQVAQAKMMAIKAQQYAPLKQEGEKWMAANAKKPGVKTLPSGLQYKVIKEGNGELPKDTSIVRVNYEGKTINGKVFDSSYKRGEPVAMRVNQVIKGWTEALVRMPVGSVWEIYIPQDLAYGEREMGEIKPYSPLVFKLELVGLGEK